MKLIEDILTKIKIENSKLNITSIGINSDFIRLADELSKMNKYESFANGTHWFGSFGTEVSFERLAFWMVKKALESSPKKAIDIVDSYLEMEHIPMQLVAIITNNVDNNFIFCNDVQISPQIIDVSLGLERLQSPINNPHAVLTINYNQRLHKKIDAPYESIYDTVDALNLATSIQTGINIIMIGSFISDKLEVPFENIQPGGWQLPSDKRSYIMPPLIGIELSKADKILRNLTSLNQKTKDSLKVSLSRLNSYGFSFNQVDKAIDLRICLEALFLGADNNDHNQLRYRMALRAAKYLGEGLDQRKEFFKLFRDAYDLTSSAVHGGRVSKKHDQTILNKTAELTQKALIKIIQNNEDINWLKIELD